MRYGRGDNYQDAIRLLLDARQLDRDSAAPCWYLADSYLIASVRPRVSPRRAGGGCARAGALGGRRSSRAGWDALRPGLLYAASLEHQAAARLGETPSLHWSQAIVALERSLAVDPGDDSSITRRRTLLAASYRNVQCPLNALQVLEPMETWTHDVDALDERAAA